MEITIKYHKSNTIRNWKAYGVIYDNFDILYQHYIDSKSCEWCGKVFENTFDRCLDHDHQTGAFRLVVCRNCNNSDSYIKYPNGYTQEDRKQNQKKYNIVNVDAIREHKKQYAIDNKDAIRVYQKQYKKNNADKQKEYKKQYNIDNNDKIKEKSKEKYTCECGSILTKKTKARHEKTKKHINFLNIL